MQIAPDLATQPAAVQNQVSPRLAKAAHQFEASLMQELLKPMQHSTLFSGDTQGDSGDALTSFGAEAMAEAMSERGGFGIARQIIAHLAPPESSPLALVGQVGGKPQAQ